MRHWIAALVSAVIQPCSGFTHSGYLGTVAIGDHGEILAVDDTKDAHDVAVVDTRNKDDRLEEMGSKRAGLLRQEGDEVGHQKHHTMLERRRFAKRHGNIFATRRLLQRTGAWARLWTFNGIPTQVTSSTLVPIIIGTILIGFLVTILQCVVSMRQRSARETETHEDGDGGSGGLGEGEQTPAVEHDFKRSPSALDEDIYGMGVAALIRDMQRVALGSESKGLRVSRMMISLLTLIFTMTLQVFLLVEMKHLVTSVSTNESQDDYEKYEVLMYGNDKSKMTHLSDGQVRGVPSQFNATRFDGLSAEMKDAICQVPLSQPTFFIAILLVWTLVCTHELRNAFDMGGALLLSTPTIADMKESIIETDRKGDEGVIVVGLTFPIKVTAIVMIVIPRILVTVCLLWLGCRWLTGTFGFSDVLQNAVALEFILLLKFVFYDAITPAHNKKETQNTLLQPYVDSESPSRMVFLGAFTWGIVSIVWVFLYILIFQQVLPDYQWDIHDACVDYLAGVEARTPGS